MNFFAHMEAGKFFAHIEMNQIEDRGKTAHYVDYLELKFVNLLVTKIISLRASEGLTLCFQSGFFRDQHS